MSLDWLSWVATDYPAILAAVFAGLAYLFSHRNQVSIARVFVQLEALALALPAGKGTSVSSTPPDARTESISTVLARGAGGTQSFTPPRSLSVLPAWSEQYVLGDDGSPADQHDNLCGEVCVAAIVAAVHGVPTDPSDHRTHAHGFAGSALTDSNDLAGMLQHCSIGASAHSLGWADAHMLITARLGEGCYTIVLCAPDWLGFVLHWVVPVGHGEGGYNVFDPWAGIIRTVSDRDMARWYNGQMVTTSARPHYDASHWAMPPL